ncbi:MAG: hypothetical protein ACOCQX_00930 [Candidatus Nanoarchaeia archaeon]
MVRYAENSFERIVNKLVFISLFVIVVMLIFDVFSLVNGTANPLREAVLPLGIIINIIFLIDLLIIFRKRTSIPEFLRHNWLDIIAVIPFDIFRLAKVARVAKLSRWAKLTNQGRLINFFSRIQINGAKLFSKETEFNKHVDKTRDKIFDMKLNKLEQEMDSLASRIKRISE